NGDGDAADDVVEVYQVGLPGWTNTGRAGDFITAVGNRVAFIMPEDKQGSDLNGDEDGNDRVADVWDPATGVRNIGIAAADVVLGAEAGTTCGTRQLLAI